MRLLVGTMYTDENEFDECVNSIKRQTHADFEHLIIRNLPNKQAHDTLYRTFMEKASEFDLLVKVDADMVLARNDLFEKIIFKFKEDSHIEQMQIALHDWYSDRLIWGLNTFKNTVKWPSTNDTIFVDKTPVSREHIIYDNIELAPAAFHCPNPSNIQAFRYGIHKAMKIMQPDRKKNNSAHVKFHWQTLCETEKHFSRCKDVRLGLTLLGAEMAFAALFSIDSLNYANPAANDSLKQIKPITYNYITTILKKLKFRNFGFLPSLMRRNLLASRYGQRLLQSHSVKDFR